MNKSQKQQVIKGTTIQKVFFVLLMIITLPWSLVYLFLWHGRCVNCSKRILFHKRVCKKCMTRSEAIVNDFPSLMETFYSQLLTFENIEEIFDQYGYILDRIDEIVEIYDALDEEVDYMSMKSLVLEKLEDTCDVWFKNQVPQFQKNVAYRANTIKYLSTEGKEHIEFIPTADDLLERINEVEVEE